VRILTLYFVYLYSTKNKTMNTIQKQEISVTETELISIFKDIENQVPSPFLSVTMDTEFDKVYKKSKTDGELNPYYKGLRKVSTRTYRLVIDYQQRVWNNLVKEGKDPNTFEVESPSGKKHISKSVLVDTKTETIHYVMLEWFVNQHSSTQYTFENNPIEKVMFEKWLKDIETPTNDKQDLDKPVTPITPKITNIVSVSVNGVKYILQK
jgi:hypothetical protein